MNLKKRTLVIALAVMTALTVTTSIVSGQNIQDKQPPDLSNTNERTIEGVWRTAVTPRNCQTGLPVAPVIRGLFTFHNGGTMSEYGIGPGQTPALRSPGHGVWQRENGSRAYSFKFIMYRYDANGAFIGSQKVTANLLVNLDVLTLSLIHI